MYAKGSFHSPQPVDFVYVRRKRNATMPFEEFRKVDDFLIGSARYAMPNYQNLERWNHRIVQNLLYYQTNYFCMAGVVAAVFAFINVGQAFNILLAIAVVAGVYAVLIIGPTQGPTPGAGGNGVLADVAALVPEQSRRHVLYGVAVFAVWILYMVGALLNALLIVLVPIFIVLVHASFRKRTVNNRVANLLYARARSTPMGRLLDALDRYIVVVDDPRDN